VSSQRVVYRAGKLDANRQRRLEALPGWTWVQQQKRPPAPWEVVFGLLVKYTEREGDARVPRLHLEDGLPLGSWVHKQRNAYKVGKLEAGRQRRLEAALPGWTWNLLEAQWEEAFGLMERYVEREGDALVPTSHTEDGYKLGSWVSNQRFGQAAGKLDADRQRRLEALPGWTWNLLEAQWEEAFGLMERYVEREGDALVPQHYTEDGFKLGSWVSNQRVGQAAGKLDADRQRRLEGLPGWTWEPMDDQWEGAFASLEQYAEREGHARVPAKYREDGFRLGWWVGTQRQAYKTGKLNADRQGRLEALPGWSWDPFETDWEKAFALLVQYAERERHARVPAQCEEDSLKLGTWVSSQRKAHKAGKLDADRQRRLEGLPGWSWRPEPRDGATK
jgi:Helicase associated domain